MVLMVPLRKLKLQKIPGLCPMSRANRTDSQPLNPGGMFSNPPGPSPCLPSFSGTILVYQRGFKKKKKRRRKEKHTLFFFFLNRQNDGCDDPSRSFSTSKFYSFDTNNSRHQVLSVRLRPVTNFPTKSGAEQETGMLKDHCRGSHFFPF